MKKTATLIMLDKPILVNEEQPAQTDYAYKNGEIILVKLDTSVSKFFGGKLVIAGHEGTKRLTFNLSEEDAKRIGYLDVEKLTEEKCPIFSGESENTNRLAINLISKDCFKKGIELGLSLTPKKYTEEDVLEFGLICAKFVIHDKGADKTRKELLEIFLKQRKPQQFKVEYTETETEITITKLL